MSTHKDQSECEHEELKEGYCKACYEFVCTHEEFEDSYCLECGAFQGEIFDYSDYYKQEARNTKLYEYTLLVSDAYLLKGFSR
jgi:hypothetical protein